MAWELLVVVQYEDEVFSEVYTSENLSSPEFARGYICGFLASEGIEPEQIGFKLYVSGLYGCWYRLQQAAKGLLERWRGDGDGTSQE